MPVLRGMTKIVDGNARKKRIIEGGLTYDSGEQRAFHLFMLTLSDRPRNVKVSAAPQGSAGAPPEDFPAASHPEPDTYSCRSATMGSTLVARRAGTNPARSAVTIIKAATTTKITGFVAVVP